MASEALRILLVEDNPGDARLIREMLVAPGGRDFVLDDCEALSDALARLSGGAFAVVLLDLSLAESQGMETFNAVHNRIPGVPVVVLTGLNDEALAAEALCAGAQDYLVKGQVDRNLLARSLRYAVERGRIEEQLRQRALELVDAAKRKDEFLAILSHELRNPLSPLSMAAELLRKNQLGEEDRQWAQEIIERQVRILSRLVDDLLDISRLSRGKINLRQEPTDLLLAIRGAIRATRPLFETHQHELSVSLPNVQIWISGDPVRLEQIMVNLLTNAAKYTPRGGHVWIEATSQGENAIVRVRDTGIGIPPHMLDRIFELFTQVDSSTNRQYQWGMGVGLALVRSFVELHGGTITAGSDGQGKGSEFVISLPLLKDQPGAVSPKETSAASASIADRPRRVLIAEDHLDSAQCMAYTLKKWRYEVRTVNNGPEALTAAGEFRPDAILLDIGLPGMDGYEVARKLREQPMFSHTLILALTGFGRDEDRQRASTAGFDSHLTKPVDPEQLRKLLAAET